MKITKQELANIIKEEVERALGEQEQQISSEDKTIFVIAAVKYLTKTKINDLPKPTKSLQGEPERDSVLDYRTSIHNLQLKELKQVCSIIKDFENGKMEKIERLYKRFAEHDKSIGGAIEKIAKTVELRNIQCSGF